MRQLLRVARRRQSVTILKAVAFVLALVAVSLLIALWATSPSYQIEGLTVNMHAYFAPSGHTSLEVPPLGEVTAKTHSFPLALKVTIKRLSMSYLTKVAAPNFSVDRFLLGIQQEGKKAIINYTLRLLLLALTLNFLLFWLVRRRWQWLSLISAFLITILIFSSTFVIKNQYNLAAFRQPRYFGLLTFAPWLVGTVEEKLNDFEAFRAEVRQLAANLYNFYAKTGNFSELNLDNNSLKILHVSDIHNNLAAFDLIKQVVKDFKVDFIVDTGDMTDLGTPLEAELVSRAKSIGRPYLYLGGNHDATEALAKLAAEADITVISQPKMVVKEGLKILALPDPALSNLSAETVSGVELKSWQKTYYQIYQKNKVKPDIVLSHQLDLVKSLVDKVPLILVGHDHKPYIKTHKRSLIVNAGTTGAAGIRGLQANNLPMSLKVLYFNKSSKRLLAIDSLTVQPLNNEFFLQRSLIKSSAPKNLPISQRSSSFRMSWLKKVN